ncbi:hypothetical protein PFISCL1PPCAC_23756, partial [Pristionchus fissidentatus]
ESPKIHILYANIRSILNVTNQNHLKILLDSQKYSILAFSESWLKQNVPDGLVLGENARSYQILRCDRKKKKGGETVNDAYEILIFDAMISSILIRFCIVYRVPALSQELSEGIWGKIIDYSICQHPIIVMGDFNIPNLKWPLDDEKEYNGLEGDFKDFLEMANMTQLVDKPTRDNNFLDLLLTNGDELIRNVEILPEIGNSDHRTIEFQLSISHKPPKCINRRNFSKGNYQTINSILAKINWSLVFKCDDSTNIMYEKLLSILEVIIEFRVPMTRVNMSGMPIPPFIEKQMKFRFLYWQKWITSNDPLYKGEFQRAHKICMKSMKKYVKNREKTILSSADKKGFYRYIKSKLSDTKGSKIDSLVGVNGIISETDSDKANCLAHAFSEVFTVDDGQTPIFTHAREAISSPDYDEMFSRHEICRLIEEWKNSSCRTPDNINLFFIKKIAVPLSIPLEIIFNKSYEKTEIPKRWKHSIITPLRKKAPFNDPLNYRPVSITSFFCRVFEKCISKGIINDCEKKNHARDICVKAESKANMIFRALQTEDTQTLVNAYCIYVRPTLEFSSSAARPINSTDRGKIEKVQNAVTRRILYRTMNYTYSNRPNYSTRNEMLNISSLEYRRNVNDIKIAYQMIFGNGRLSKVMPDFFSLVRTRTRGAGYKVDIDMAKLKQRENSFAHRISKLLISLLQKVKLPTNYSEFTKRMIDE